MKAIKVIKGTFAFLLVIVAIFVACSIKGTVGGTIPAGTAIAIIFVCIGIIVAMYKKF